MITEAAGYTASDAPAPAGKAHPVTRDTLITLTTALAWAGEHRSPQTPNPDALVDSVLHGIIA